MTKLTLKPIYLALLAASMSFRAFGDSSLTLTGTLNDSGASLIVGGGSLTVNNTGNSGGLIESGISTSGATLLGAGTISSSAFVATSVVVADNNIESLGGGTTLDDNGTGITLANAVSASGTITFASTGNGSLTFSGAGLTTSGSFTLTNNTDLYVNNTTTIADNISNSTGYTLTKYGAGTLTLGGATNLNSGLIIVSNGSFSTGTSGEISFVEIGTNSGTVVLTGATSPPTYGTLQGKGTNDVALIEIQKEIRYDQSNASAPVLDPEVPYAFTSVIEPENGASLPYATLSPPPGSLGSAAYSANDGSYSFFEGFASQADLDNSFANGRGLGGSYDILLQTSLPATHSATVSFNADDYPSAPQLTNTTWNGNCLVIDPTKPFTFTWPSAVGQLIDFGIDGTDVSAEVPSTQTSFVLPANTLAPNRTYTAYLKSKIVAATLSGTTIDLSGTTTDPKLQSTFAAEVNFVIKTGNVPAPAPSYNYVLKEQVMTQTSTLAPTSSTATSFVPGPFLFSASSPIAGAISSPVPTTTVYPLSFNAMNGVLGQFVYNSYPGTQASVNATYPSGTYTLSDGAKVGLNGDVYPKASQIVSVNGQTPVWTVLGQLALNPNIDNKLVWTANANSATYTFATGGHEEFTLSGVGDGVKIKQVSGVGEASPGSFASYTIPAGTLTDGCIYQGAIRYFLASALLNPTAHSYDAAGYETTTNFSALGVKPTFTGVSKVAVKIQNSNNAPANALGTTASPAPFKFTEFSVANGDFTLSGAPSYGLTYNSTDNQYEYTSPSQTTLVNLNTAYPDGLYQTPTGAQVSLTGQKFPSVPQVTLVNGATPIWANGQLVLNPLIDNELTLSSYAGSTGTYTFATGGRQIAEISGNQDDFDIKQEAFGPEGDSPFTTLLVPAHTLTNGHTYTGDLTYFLASSLTLRPQLRVILLGEPLANSYSVAGYAHETNFVISAATPAFKLYEVEKNAVKLQTSNDTPKGAPVTNSFGGDPGPYNFYAEAPAAGSVTGPTSAYALNVPTGFGAYRYLSPGLSSLANLNAAYPDGLYTFSNSGTVTLSGGSFPATPMVTLVNGATPVWNANGQLVLPAGQDNILTFTTYAGSNSSYNFATGGYESIEIDGLSDNLKIKQEASGPKGDSPFTTLTIPANSLKIGNAYTGAIGFKLCSSHSYSPVTNTSYSANYQHKTYFTISPSP